MLGRAARVLPACRQVTGWGRRLQMRALSTEGTGTDLWSAMKKTATEAEKPEAPKESWVEMRDEKAENRRQKKAMLKRRRNPIKEESGFIYYKLKSEPIEAPFKTIEVPARYLGIKAINELIQEDREDRADIGTDHDIPAQLYDPKRKMWLLSRYRHWKMLPMPQHLLVHDDYQIVTRNFIESILRKTGDAISLNDMWEAIQKSGKEFPMVSSEADLRTCLDRMVKDGNAERSFVRDPETQRKTKVPGWHIKSSRRLEILVEAQRAYLYARRDLRACDLATDTAELEAATKKVETSKAELDATEDEFDFGMRWYRRTSEKVVKMVTEQIANDELPEAVKWDKKKRWSGFMWTEWWKDRNPLEDLDTDDFLEFLGKEESAFWHEFLDVDSPVRKTTLYKRRLHPSVDEYKRQGVYIEKGFKGQSKE